MKLNGLSILFFLAALGLGGWASFERAKRQEAEARLVAVSAERDAYQKTATKKLALQAKTDVKAEGPEGLGPDHAEELAKEQSGGKKEGTPAPVDELGAMGNGFQEMMNDPKMKEAMKAQVRSGMELQYRDLFDLLGLDEAKQNELSKLLADRTSAGMEMGFAMMGGEPKDPETIKKMNEAMKAAQEASDKALKSLLGEEGFSKFDRFEKSQPERQQLNAFNGQLKDKGMGLTPEVESQLMDAMYQERTTFKYDYNLADQTSFDPANLNEAAIQRFSEQQTELRSKILTRAEGILTPEQLALFEQNQAQTATMEKLGMEMGLKMMKGQKQ